MRRSWKAVGVVRLVLGARLVRRGDADVDVDADVVDLVLLSHVPLRVAIKLRVLSVEKEETGVEIFSPATTLFGTTLGLARPLPHT